MGVSRWVGDRLVRPGLPMLEGQPLERGQRWPTAAYGANGKAWAVDISMWPRHEPYRHLSDLVKLDKAPQLSARATEGFFSRTQKSSLNFVDEFLVDVAEHAAVMAEELAVA